MTELKKFSNECIDENELGNVKITVDKNSIYDDYLLFNFKTSTGYPLASLAWMGTSLSTGGKIFQPAIVTNIPGVTTYLSYSGCANYIGGSDIISMPSDGSKYTISPPKPYYFKNDDLLTHNPTYALDQNNKSIEMKNISLFTEDYSQGAMIKLRASMEGSIDGVSDDGCVVILLTINTIN